jgi:predicted outer membrane repeat protein
MSNKLSCLMSLGLVLFLVGFAQAETIAIPDAGFDDSPLSAGGYAYIGEGAWAGEFDYAGPWQSSGGDAWLDNGYYLAAGDAADLPALSGTNKLYGRDDTEDYVYQILDATYVEGATYTLSVSVGQPWEGYDNGWWLYFTGENYENNLAEASGNAPLAWEQVSLVYTATAADAGNKIGIKMKGDQYVSFEDVTLTYVAGAAAGITIPVDPTSDLAAANAMAQAGDTIEFAAGTYILTSQIDVRSGVTYLGAGPELTILDGDNLTRAFAAWGDRGATSGTGLQNASGPMDWIIDGMTIQNCVSDTENRQDILAAALDLLNNYTGTPYTLATAQDENGGIGQSPEWFDILSGSADDDLTDIELQAYLDNIPVGSAGHLTVNGDKKDDGGAICILSSAKGVIRNCTFTGNSAVDDGGAIMVDDWYLDITIENCAFTLNTCGDQAGAVKLSGAASNSTVVGCSFTENSAPDDDGGAIQMDGAGTGSVYTLTDCTFTNNSANDDGGAIFASADNSTYVWTNCAFIGNYVVSSGSDGGAVRYSPDRADMTVLNCSFIGNGKDPEGTAVGDDGGVWKTDDDDCGPVTFMNCLFAENASKDDRILEVKGVSSILNCTFINNVVGDEALIAVRGKDWDSTGDGADDATTDDSIIDNCLFINNTLNSNKQIIGDTNNDVFAPVVTNCLFFGNLDQNGDPAINVDGNSQEAGTIDASAVTDAAQLVVDPAGDYHLAVGSAAIDASNPATATEADINGIPAVGARDVGAYEYVGQ